MPPLLLWRCGQPGKHGLAARSPLKEPHVSNFHNWTKPPSHTYPTKLSSPPHILDPNQHLTQVAFYSLAYTGRNTNEHHIQKSWNAFEKDGASNGKMFLEVAVLWNRMNHISVKRWIPVLTARGHSLPYCSTHLRPSPPSEPDFTSRNHPHHPQEETIPSPSPNSTLHSF